MLQADLLFADRYRLIKCIGHGGFAEVWLAEDTLADLQVAIKIYGGMDNDGLKIFVKEINKVYHLNHTNLLKPQHVAAWNNMPYLVMTYCAVGSCEKLIGKVTEKEVWKILHDAASGLAYLHSNNIIHQDIKPANILQDDMGNYVIIDFGISTLARDTLRKSTLRGNTSAGTLAYMAPERFSKDPTPLFASDIWSLGAMLFELLEGKTPFPADFGGGMQKAGAELLDITADVSQELKSLLYKMLSLNTWDRPTATTLVEWAKNPSAIVEKTSRPTHRKITKLAEQPQQPKEPTPKRWIWIILTLLLIAGLGMIGIRKYQDYQLEIAIKEQIRQDSICQIQDSIREVRRQDSIRIEQERIRRQDSIAAEQERLHLEAQEAERKRIENEIRLAEEESKRKAYDNLILGSGKHNGYVYVDLGLSVKWATNNLGATKPEENGYYIRWGEDKPSSKKYLYELNPTILPLSNDAAYLNWGGSWRMPTIEECDELIYSCLWTWTSVNNVKGCMVTSPKTGNSIFLPATGSGGYYGQEDDYIGRYWSSSIFENGYSYAYILTIASSRPDCIYSLRYSEYSVRAVCP